MFVRRISPIMTVRVVLSSTSICRGAEHTVGATMELDLDWRRVRDSSIAMRMRLHMPVANVGDVDALSCYVVISLRRSRGI